MHYLVTYDLNRPGQNYAKLYAALGTYPDNWHYQESAWIVGPAATSFEVAEFLRPYVDANDSVLVTALTEDTSWFGLGPEGDAWIQAVT